MTIEPLTVESPMPERAHLLTAAKLSPLLVPQLEAAFTVHDRLHDTAPAAFTAVAPQIRAIAASGDSRVSGELIAQLPALAANFILQVAFYVVAGLAWVLPAMPLIRWMSRPDAAARG